MNLSLYIARRYLFSKKSHNAVNVISLVSMAGVAIATAAMVCTMSVFGGFQALVSDMFSSLDPEIKITVKEGKTFDPQSEEIRKLRALDGIDIFTEILEDNVLLKYRGRQVPAILKGVSDNFAQLTDIDSILYDGQFKLRDELNDFGTIGIDLAMRVGIGAGFAYPLEVYAVKRKQKVNLANPASTFSTNYLYISGVFRTNQELYDRQVLIAPISMVRELFDYPSEVSAIELRLTAGAKSFLIQSQIEEILGTNYAVKNRYQQQENTFRMMEIEKWITFLLLTFICLIAVFNVVSSLSMLIVEKKDDVFILRNLGASNRLISSIFLFEGWMISILGAIAGLGSGIALCWVQKQFGLIRFGSEAGVAIVDTYPVVVSGPDISLIFGTVLTIGFLAALYPSRYLSNRWLKQEL